MWPRGSGREPDVFALFPTSASRYSGSRQMINYYSMFCGYLWFVKVVIRFVKT
nr:hypothetical protein RVX_1553 [Nitratidesulfovibrio sp. HK-II]